jgi:hypothetical protein
MLVLAGATDVTTYFQLRLLAGTDATGLTIADFDMQYVRTGATPAAKVDAVALAAANTAHTDNRGIEVDATDTPGLYRFDWPDAAFAAGVAEAILTIKHTSIITESLRVQIVGFNPADGVRLGLTALPNAVPAGNGGLPTVDASNRVVGIQGTITTLDALDTAQDTQHGTTQTAVGNVQTTSNSINAKTTNLPTDPADQSLIIAETNNILAVLGTPDADVSADIAAVLAQVALVKAKTDLVPGTQDGLTFAQVTMLVAAVLLGKASGLGTTTATFRAADDGADRVTATVDAVGNRSAVTLNTA